MNLKELELKIQNSLRVRLLSKLLNTGIIFSRLEINTHFAIIVTDDPFFFEKMGLAADDDRKAAWIKTDVGVQKIFIRSYNGTLARNDLDS